MTLTSNTQKPGDNSGGEPGSISLTHSDYNSDTQHDSVSSLTRSSPKGQSDTPLNRITDNVRLLSELITDLNEELRSLPEDTVRLPSIDISKPLDTKQVAVLFSDLQKLMQQQLTDEQNNDPLLAKLKEIFQPPLTNAQRKELSFDKLKSILQPLLSDEQKESSFETVLQKALKLQLDNKSKISQTDLENLFKCQLSVEAKDDIIKIARFHLACELSKYIRNLPADLPPQIMSFTNPDISNPWEIEQLTSLFIALNNLPKAHYSVAQNNELSKAKNCTMQIALYQLDPARYVDPTTPPAKWYQIILSVVALFLGFIYASAESFTGAWDLFSSVIGLSIPVSLTICVAFSVLSDFLFFALEAPALVLGIGIHSPSNIYSALRTAKNKLTSTKAISDKLHFADENSKISQDMKLYEENFELLKLFQEDIIKDHRLMRVPDTFLHKWVLPALKNTFYACGIGLYGLSGILIAKDFIINIATLLYGPSITTLWVAMTTLTLPVSAGILTSLTAAGVVLYFALQSSAVLDLFKAIFHRPKDLFEEQEVFCESIASTNNAIRKNIFSGEVNQLLSMSPVTRGRHLEGTASNGHTTTNAQVTRALSSANATNGVTIIGDPQPARKLKGAYANDHLSITRQRLFSALRQESIVPAQCTAEGNIPNLR